SMYSRLPAFVFGFHGCDQTTKEAVLFGNEFLRPSKNNYDWLGSGIYFWEQNYQRALEFATLAKQNPGKYTSFPINNPAVLGAIIDLGNCLNLMDAFHINRLRLAHSYLEKVTNIAEVSLPHNRGFDPDKPLRILDRTVIEALHLFIENNAGGQVIDENLGSESYDTVRGLFQEGDPVYKGAGFKAQTHIQICVRNINCIKGFFDPREKCSDPFGHLK
ncbi:MAG: hypothetical protein GX549_07760, partial [Clostridiales bacterium]|nr:hypothetical protein [Clostridiales bacterium]